MVPAYLLLLPLQSRCSVGQCLWRGQRITRSRNGLEAHVGGRPSAGACAVWLGPLGGPPRGEPPPPPPPFPPSLQILRDFGILLPRSVCFWPPSEERQECSRNPRGIGGFLPLTRPLPVALGCCRCGRPRQRGSRCSTSARTRYRTSTPAASRDPSACRPCASAATASGPGRSRRSPGRSRASRSCCSQETPSRGPRSTPLRAARRPCGASTSQVSTRTFF